MTERENVDDYDRSDRRQELFRLADRIFGDPRKAASWLRRQNASLGGVSPLDLLETNDGAARVEEKLHQIDQGCFT